MTHILKDNLISALRMAVRRLEELGRGESAQACGFRDNIAALERGEHIEVRP